MRCRSAVLVACLAFATVVPHGWVRADPVVAQIGGDIVGAGGGFGRSLATSADGTRVVVGAPSERSGGGSVRVYDVDEELRDWTMVGNEFQGAGGEPEFGFGDHLGTSVDLSADGSRLAIGAPTVWDVETQVGRVAVHEWDGLAWRQLGDGITGTGIGTDVSMSGDGTRVAVSGTSSVEVFEWTGTEWATVGPGIADDSSDLASGRSVELSATGDRLAVGSWGNPEIDPPIPGSVKVFDWDGTAWTQSGSELRGPTGDRLFGWDLALSEPATRLVVLTMADVDGAETASVFDWEGGEWRLGGVASGAADRSWQDTSVAISADGRRLAIADSRDDTFVFDWDGATWQRTARLDRGATIALGLDGGRIAIGEPWFTIAPPDEPPSVAPGRVRVFELFPGAEDFDLDTRCEGPEDEPGQHRGILSVAIDDRTARSYELHLEGVSTGIRELLRLGDEGGGRLEYGPYPDDTYQIVIEPVTNRSVELLIDQLTIECSTTTSTTHPTSAPATPSSLPTDGILPPTGPGRASPNLLGIAVASLVLGFVLVIVRRPAR